MTSLHDIKLGKYENVNYIKPDFGLIPVSNPESTSDLDDIYDSNDDKESVLSTPSFLPKHHTSVLPANKDEDEDIKMSFLPDLSRP